MRWNSLERKGQEEEIGIVTGVFLEEGAGTYRLSLIIRGEEKWAFDYSLTLVEAA